VIYASGTNDPSDDPAVLRTRDGGATWDLIDMSAHASLLVDIHFQDRNRGWVVGGRDVIACPGRRATRDVVRPVVLFTEDGGNTWTDLIPAKAKRRFPLGEWGWKIFFLDDRIAFISLEKSTVRSSNPLTVASRGTDCGSMTDSATRILKALASSPRTQAG
jgi:hypothetical protein